MKAYIEAVAPNGQKYPKRLWGVDFFPEKRQPRAAFRPQVIGVNADGTSITDEDTPAHAARLDEMANRQLAWGEEVEVVTAAHYSVRICLLGVSRYVGSTGTPMAAAQLYDSALFHLWGFAKKPRARFNFYKPGDEDPEYLPRVRELRRKLGMETDRHGTDTIAFDYNFSQRNDHL